MRLRKKYKHSGLINIAKIKDISENTLQGILKVNKSMTCSPPRATREGGTQFRDKAKFETSPRSSSANTKGALGLIEKAKDSGR